MRRVLGCALLLAIGWSMPACAQSGVVVDGELGRKLDAAVQAWAEGKFWGVVLVAREGKVALAKGYGMADLDKTPITPRHLFDIGSVSKQFTGAAIVKLESQGKLKTDDPLAKYFPGAPDDKRAITIHQLATHVSGLTDSPAWEEADFADRDRMVARVLAAPLVEPAGTKFRYNNVGYFVLAAVIEKAAGEPFEAVLSQHLFQPAGMKDTGFVQSRDLDRARETARVFGPESGGARSTVLEYSWNWANKGATGVVTTAYDLLAWDQALRGDRVLSSAAREKLFRPSADRYGYGWFIAETLTGSPKIHHGGATRGYRAHLSRYPTENVVVIVLTNEAGDPDGLEARLESIALGGGGPDAATLARCAGTYALPCGDRFEIAATGEGLEVRALGTQAACRVFYGSKEMPEWPGYFERVAQAVDERIGPLRRDDASGFRTGCESATAADGATAAWQECVKKLGKWQSGAVLGTHSGRTVVTYLREVFGKTPATFRVEWTADLHVAALARSEDPNPFRLALTPKPAGGFATRCLTQQGVVSLVFSVKGKAPATGLVWRDGTAKEPEGIVCPRVP